MLVFFKKYFFLFVMAAVIIAGVSLANNAASAAKMPNPITEVQTIEQAQNILGFKPKLPQALKQNMSEKLLVINKKLLSAVYTDENGKKTTYRISKLQQGDISGDYNKYSAIKTEFADKTEITLKGTAENQYCLALWNDGEYSYSYNSETPFSAYDFFKVYETIK